MLRSCADLKKLPKGDLADDTLTNNDNFDIHSDNKMFGNVLNVATQIWYQSNNLRNYDWKRARRTVSLYCAVQFQDIYGKTVKTMVVGYGKYLEKARF